MKNRDQKLLEEAYENVQNGFQFIQGEELFIEEVCRDVYEKLVDKIQTIFLQILQKQFETRQTEDGDYLEDDDEPVLQLAEILWGYHFLPLYHLLSGISNSKSKLAEELTDFYSYRVYKTFRGKVHVALDEHEQVQICIHNADGAAPALYWNGKRFPMNDKKNILESLKACFANVLKEWVTRVKTDDNYKEFNMWRNNKLKFEKIYGRLPELKGMFD